MLGHGSRSLPTMRFTNLRTTSFCLVKSSDFAITLAFADRRQAIRLLSSIPPSTTNATPEKTPMPEPLITARKVKVELRPGPVKLTQTTRPSNDSPQMLAKPHNAPRVEKPSPALFSPADSATETTKRDFEHAARHGILTPPPPDASRFKRLFHQAWQLLKFYGRGLKMINTNRKQVVSIKRRVKAGGDPISRWETRFIRTYREDAIKLAPFLVIVALLEEVIPLIAIYAPFMLPSTCILPSQRDRIENAKRSKQVAYAHGNQPLFKHLSSSQSGQVPLAVLYGNAPLPEVMCGILRLSTFGLSTMRVWRIRRHLRYITTDDGLLVREDMGAKLSPLEVTEALLERGMIATNLSENEQVARLKEWLTLTCSSDQVDPVAQRIFIIAKNAA